MKLLRGFCIIITVLLLSTMLISCNGSQEQQTESESNDINNC